MLSAPLDTVTPATASAPDDTLGDTSIPDRTARRTRRRPQTPMATGTTPARPTQRSDTTPSPTAPTIDAATSTPIPRYWPPTMEPAVGRPAVREETNRIVRTTTSSTFVPANIAIAAETVPRNCSTVFT